MTRNTLNHRRDGMPRTGNEETNAFAQERYQDLLREAEQYRLEQRVAGQRALNSPEAGQSLARLLSWAKIRWTGLTHAA